MLRYFRNLSLLLILSLAGCFLTFIGFLFCCFILAISPLLGFHIKSLLKIDKVVINE